MKTKISKFVYWTPRILSIAFILFLAMFSLDIFDGNYDFWGTILGLFMHNIPVFILTIILIIAWKHEIVGAITFFLAGLLYITRLMITMIINGFEWYGLSYSFIVAGPAFFIGVLFLVGWKLKKEKKSKKR